MKITIESTEHVVWLDQGPQGRAAARLWTGQTETGIPVHAYIAVVMPLIDKSDPIIDEKCAEFDRDLCRSDIGDPVTIEAAPHVRRAKP